MLCLLKIEANFTLAFGQQLGQLSLLLLTIFWSCTRTTAVRFYSSANISVLIMWNASHWHQILSSTTQHCFIASILKSRSLPKGWRAEFAFKKETEINPKAEEELLSAVWYYSSTDLVCKCHEKGKFSLPSRSPLLSHLLTAEAQEDLRGVYRKLSISQSSRQTKEQTHSKLQSVLQSLEWEVAVENKHERCNISKTSQESSSNSRSCFLVNTHSLGI